MREKMTVGVMGRDTVIIFLGRGVPFGISCYGFIEG